MNYGTLELSITAVPCQRPGMCTFEVEAGDACIYQHIDEALIATYREHRGEAGVREFVRAEIGAAIDCLFLEQGKRAAA